jgi:hypothetical protein
MMFGIWSWSYCIGLCPIHLDLLLVAGEQEPELDSSWVRACLTIMLSDQITVTAENKTTQQPNVSI